MYCEIVLYWLCFNSLKDMQAPSQVTGVSLTKSVRLGKPCLIVTWTAPQSDANISRYNIQYRSAEGFWGSKTTIPGSPPATTFTLMPLDTGTNYSVRVSAVSAIGTGVWSAEQTKETYRCEYLCIVCVMRNMHLHLWQYCNNFLTYRVHMNTQLSWACFQLTWL